MKVTWKTPGGGEVTADVTEGTSMMQAALDNNVDGIIGECGGTMSCATCHVIVDAAWADKVGGPGDFEEAMLDITEAERTDNSRLSCQIEASSDLDGLVLIVPEV